MHANPLEARELGAELRRPHTVEVRAETRLDDASLLSLVGTEHGFRLEDPLTRFYDQSSPRRALCAFVRAIERERWDVVLNLMPRADREALGSARAEASLSARREELGRIAARLWSARRLPIEVVGDRATLPYQDSFSARFIREEGLWRVESPE
ncbi:MAG TPA: hypothetical protein VI299_08200 [Polyangiales bacterium]